MRQAIAILCVVTLPGATTLALAQDDTPAGYAPPTYQVPPRPAPQNTPLLTADQLDNLVAPVALYPDPLLGEVLAASTYPLEIIEAQQWLNENRNLSGQQLIDAAKQQNWDPSVQALVAFPDALTLLGRDIQWTTDLGNAFLAQQADVMNAVQQLRARAEQNGRLESSPQETVTGDPGAIQIQPANPQIVYVPVYNPAYVWGPPAWGAYPPLWYPPVSYGCGFGVGVFLGGLFAGFLGFGGWGWGLSWLAHGLFLNGLFFHHFGFGGYGGIARTAWWSHDPAHRMGVAYPNRTVAARYAGAAGRRGAGRFSPRAYSANRTYSSGAWRGFNNRAYSAPRNNFAANYRNFSSPRSYEGNSFRAPQQSYRNSGENSFRGSRQSYRSTSNARNFGGNYRAPRTERSQHFPAPRSSGGHFRGGHSGGGHSGGHSAGGSHRR